jgi:acetyltransferase-like isoleucine patch superfamily enzyme
MSLASFVKRMPSESPRLFAAAAICWNRIFGLNRFSGTGPGNSIRGLSNALLRNSRISICGARNLVEIGRGAILTRCRIMIWGNDNQVRIGESVRAVECDIHIEDPGNTVIIGKGSSLCGRTHLAATEGKTITLGEGCLFSSDITVRTGDSHSILDFQSGIRINEAEGVAIGDRVWVGNQVIILKGAVISANSVVASGSVVTKEFSQPNVIIGGNPARVIREGVRWCTQRIGGPERHE